MHAFDLARLLEDDRVRTQGAVLSDLAESTELGLVLRRLGLECLPNLVADHRDGDLVLDAAWDDEIGNLALRRNIFVEVGFHKPKPLFDAALDIAAAFLDVSDETSREAEVGICLGKDFEIKEIQNPWVMEGKDSL